MAVILPFPGQPRKPRPDVGPGQTFGRLTLLERAIVPGERHPSWWCRCACEKVVRRRLDNILTGATRSCGCLRSARTAERNREYFARKRAQGSPTAR